MNYNPTFHEAGDYSRQPPPPPPYMPWKQVNDGKGFAVTSLVTGVLGVLFGMIPAAFLIAAPLGACALIFGFMARSRHKKLRYETLTLSGNADYYKVGMKLTLGTGDNQYTGKIKRITGNQVLVDKGRPVMAIWGIWLGALAFILGCVGFAIVMSTLNDLSNDINNIDTPTETTP